VNAVLDALRPLGVEHIDMPITPARVWNAVRSAQGQGPAAQAAVPKSIRRSDKEAIEHDYDWHEPSHLDVERSTAQRLRPRTDTRAHDPREHELLVAAAFPEENAR
jgi:hypothetical protein